MALQDIHKVRALKYMQKHAITYTKDVITNTKIKVARQFLTFGVTTPTNVFCLCFLTLAETIAMKSSH